MRGGRVELGVGVGWNAEELANHRPDVAFRQGYGAMKERVAALRALWTDDVASFSGRWDNVTPSWGLPYAGARHGAGRVGQRGPARRAPDRRPGGAL